MSDDRDDAATTPPTPEAADTARRAAEKREADRRRDGRRVAERSGDSVRAAIRTELAADGDSPDAVAERNPANPMFVQTVRGIGYRLVVAT